ncbi:MAG: N-6 DNA methylase [Lautropia sp.]|nr:N-6 DNA methylase [Lautropia sp.]
MKLTDIEDAVAKLSKHFDEHQFAAQFLAAYGRTETEIRQLSAPGSKANKSDVPHGVLIPKQIHLATCKSESLDDTLNSLRQSAATLKLKPTFILATNGEWLRAENLRDEKSLDCAYELLSDHFLFFAPLAGIRIHPEVEVKSIDIRATIRFNKLYTELLARNPGWENNEKRHAMNHFMARLIFCLFAEDTDIFPEQGMFTRTLELHSDRDGANTHEVIDALFAAMNTKDLEKGQLRYKTGEHLPPYVNGGLFAQRIEIPRFSRMARNYLLEIGKLPWNQINPDIFGSMIQAIADEEERSKLGLHYTSLPNIHKVLDPLFLDSLQQQLKEAGSNRTKLNKLLDRLKRIRVFDPACGSGNFLVAAYKAIRDIEHRAHVALGAGQYTTQIRLSNFRGIEILDFPSEVARLSLIIAQYQCDRKYHDQRKFLPLDSENSIVCGNALDIDWFQVIPPTNDDTVNNLLASAGMQNRRSARLDTDNIGGETYLCGNPPYVGSTWQSDDQKADLAKVFDKRIKNWKSLDYVAAWFMRAADYCKQDKSSSAAFVTTNSICQGQQVSTLWPEIFKTGNHIHFAHTSFKWSNHATYNAGVTVVVIGLSTNTFISRRLFSESRMGQGVAVIEDNPDVISSYLTSGETPIITKATRPLFSQSPMLFGNKPVDGGNLLLSHDELESLNLSAEQKKRFVRQFLGSSEFIKGTPRFCLWIEDRHLTEACSIPSINKRINAVRITREKSSDKGANSMANRPHQMREMNTGNRHSIIVPGVSSEHREFLPVGYLPAGSVISNLAFALHDAPLWNLSLIASRLHLLWISTVCGKMKTDFRYSNTLGWNTFPIPELSDQDKAELTRCAEEILLAREAHFPATIAELYAPGKMPANLRQAHERNDEVLEKLYNGGKRFTSDAERLSKLFAMYAEKVESLSSKKATKARASSARAGKRHQLESHDGVGMTAAATDQTMKKAAPGRGNRAKPSLPATSTVPANLDGMPTMPHPVARQRKSSWTPSERSR